MTIRLLGIAVLACAGLSACASVDSRPATPASSGVTSSNGGGQRALGDIPSVGVNTGGGANATGVSSKKGDAY